MSGYENRILQHIHICQQAGRICFLISLIMLLIWLIYVIHVRIFRCIDHLSGEKRRRFKKKIHKHNNFYRYSPEKLLCLGITGAVTIMSPVFVGDSYAFSQGEDPSPYVVEGFRIKPLKGQAHLDDVICYEEGVEASLRICDNNLDSETMVIRLIPLDDTAEAAVAGSELADELGGITLPGFVCRKEEDIYTITVTIRENGRWRLTCYCEDQAGNCLTGISEGDSEEFVIDNTPPEMEVSYNRISNILQSLPSDDSPGETVFSEPGGIPSKDCILIMDKEESEVELLIRGDHFDVNASCISVFREDGKLAEAGMEDYDLTAWKEIEEGVYLAGISFVREGNYRIEFSGKDVLGRPFTAESHKDTHTCLEEDGYHSPLICVDHTAPECSVGFSNPQKENRYNHPPTIQIEVKEEFFDPDLVRIKDKVRYADKELNQDVEEMPGPYEWNREKKEGRFIYRTEFQPEEEGIHTITVNAEDYSGNRGKSSEICFTYDSTPPEIVYTGADNREGDIIFFSDYSDKRKPALYYPYLSFSCFSGKTLKAEVKARDRVSGVKEIRYCLKGKSYEAGEKEESVKTERISLGQKEEGAGTLTGEIKVPWTNFKGKLYVRAADYCDNKGKEIECKGIISESEELHNKISDIRISLPEADYTDQEKRIRYYRKAPVIEVEYRDSWSGIQALKLTGYKGKRIIMEKEWIIPAEGEDILYQKTVKCLLKDEEGESAEESSEAEGEITLKAELTDNAGNKSVREYRDYRIVVDQSPPFVHVAYDNYDSIGQKYYKKERTATVTVRDRNFDASGVLWEIRGRQKAYEISPWSKNGEEYSCRVAFREDGNDFRLGLTASDYAGNETKWDRDKAFTIDRTPPEIVMIHNRDNAVNGNYYHSNQDIRFLIKDRNYAPDKTVWTLSGKLGEKNGKIREPAIRKEGRGDNMQYSCHLRLDRDGTYEIGLTCEDHAGNRTLLPKETLIIDKTPPKVRISDIRDGETCTEKVCPSVYVTDDNLDTNSIKIQLTRRKTDLTAEENDYPASRTMDSGGYSCCWEDFSHKEETDGIYTISISGKDLADNPVKEGPVSFYVNRYGSRYSLGMETAALCKKQFVNKEQEIHIREYSVNPVKTKVSILKNNDQRISLKEGDDYRRTTAVVTAAGKEPKYAGWRKYDYYINKEIFASEGTYHIQLQSVGIGRKSGKKRETVKTDNDLKDSTVEFTVDKTPPAVRISNLEKETYRESSHLVTFAVVDNQKFDSMEIFIRKGIFHSTIKTIKVRPEDLDSMNLYHLELKASRWPQQIDYIAFDRAGNRISSSQAGLSKKCMIFPQASKKEGEDSGIDRTTLYYLLGIAAFCGILFYIVVRVKGVRQDLDRKSA